MQHFTYHTKGTCSRVIEFDLDGTTVHNVTFLGGCPGNLMAIPKLVEGMQVAEVLDRIEGIRCGFKPTSCADQLCQALRQATK